MLGGGVPNRQYSLCGDPADRTAYRLGVLRDANGGGGSRYVHDRLAEGDVARVRGPRNNFALAPSPRYLFIAGGIGITPILPMIAAARRPVPSGTSSTAGGSGPRWRSWTSWPATASGSSVRPQDETGLLDLDTLLGTPQPDTLVYCCGPEPLLAAVEQRCAAWPARAPCTSSGSPPGR